MSRSRSPAPPRRKPARLAPLTEAAPYSRLSIKTLRRYGADGKITLYRNGAKLILVDLDEVTWVPPAPTHGAFSMRPQKSTYDQPPDAKNGAPPGKGAPASINPAKALDASTVADPPDIGPDDIAAQLRRRREASWRLPPLENGYRDPLDQLRRAAS